MTMRCGTNIEQVYTEEEYKEFLPQGIYGYKGTAVLDSSEHGLSVQPMKEFCTSKINMDTASIEGHHQALYNNQGIYRG